MVDRHFNDPTAPSQFKCSRQTLIPLIVAVARVTEQLVRLKIHFGWDSSWKRVGGSGKVSFEFELFRLKSNAKNFHKPSQSQVPSLIHAIYSITGADNATSRRDFLTYCLSLMRAHNSEHRDSLPVLDVTALRHVAYVLDAVIFYMRASNELDCDRNDSNAWDDQDDNENDDVDDEFTTSLVMDTDSIDDSDMVRPSLGKRHSFFQRSESTLCLGCPAPDSFNTPMAEALPLADQPQLLQPNARREDLFGMPKQAITVPTGDQAGSSTLELPPIRLGLSSQSKGDAAQSAGGGTNTVVISLTPSTSESQAEPTAEDGQKHLLRSARGKTVVSIVPKEDTATLKRTRSPQPGPSSIQKHFEEYEDNDESGDDEPQDLSQQALSHSKIDLDEPSSKEQKASRDVYDSDDSDADNESNMMRSPAHKKHRSMETDQVQPEDFAMLQSGSKSSSDEQSQPTDQDSDPSVRPPIIVVTRRNVADAIEAVTANVLSKNKKTTLSECVAPETPLTFLPNNFACEGEQAASSSKSSVIVRVGPSVSELSAFDALWDFTDTNFDLKHSFSSIYESKIIKVSLMVSNDQAFV